MRGQPRGASGRLAVPSGPCPSAFHSLVAGALASGRPPSGRRPDLHIGHLARRDDHGDRPHGSVRAPDGPEAPVDVLRRTWVTAPAAGLPAATHPMDEPRGQGSPQRDRGAAAGHDLLGAEDGTATGRRLRDALRQLAAEADPAADILAHRGADAKRRCARQFAGGRPGTRLCLSNRHRIDENQHRVRRTARSQWLTRLDERTVAQGSHDSRIRAAELLRGFPESRYRL